VNRGERMLPPISRIVYEEAGAKLEPDARALMGVMIDGATIPEAAVALRLEERDVQIAVQRILRSLRLEVPAARSA
jgi:hypothetical protein